MLPYAQLVSQLQDDGGGPQVAAGEQGGERDDQRVDQRRERHSGLDLERQWGLRPDVVVRGHRDGDEQQADARARFSRWAMRS